MAQVHARTAAALAGGARPRHDATVAAGIGLLGPLEVRDADGVRPIGGVKERRLLALLAVHRGQAVAVDRLFDFLWGDDPPASAAKGLQVLVARVRKALAAAPAVPIAIERVEQAYRLDAAVGTLDVDELEATLRAGRLAVAAGEWDQAVAAFERSRRLWRGLSLADIRDDALAVAEAQRLDELRAVALEEHAAALVERGDHDAAIALLEGVDHELRERRCEVRMVALARAGRSGEALRAHAEFRERLAEELGLDPSQRLQDLEGAILSDDASLQPSGRRERGLPTGEVTFLLTDVEGSTKLWEQHANAMVAAVEAHDVAIEHAVTSAGGVVLKAKGEGDSSFCVFENAAAAVDAAVQIQLAVEAGPWQDQLSMGVRIGVHTGAAQLRGGDYYGATVNRAARIRAAGHRGQVLLSSATAALARDRLPPEVSLRDLGARRLRDLREPEHLFQVEHPRLPGSFPPLAALDVRPNNLTVQPTTFLGRDAELARLIALLRRPATRLVTITGPGGMGKTRLAQQAAAELLDDFDHGVWFVGLAGVASAAEVVPAVATALQLGAEAATDESTLADALADRSLLLVVDNFEHVLDGAGLVSTLLARCPGVRVLATSRRWLQLRGEHELVLDPLDDDTVVDLFADRAEAVRPGIEDELDRSQVLAIGRALDGLPLAVELVAARLRRLTVDEITAQLGNVLDLAGEGPRDQPARHRALRATLDWSISLLDDEERSVWASLAVFRGGFDADAAAAVAGVPEQLAGTVLASLADQSLVVALGGGRFDLLVTVRAAAEEHLSRTAQLGPAQARFVAHFDDVARRWFEGRGGIRLWLWEETERLDDLVAESGNLRAAAELGLTANGLDSVHAVLAATVVLQERDVREMVSLLERLAPSVVGTRHERLVELLHAAGQMILNADFDATIERVSEIMGAASSRGEAVDLGVWNYLGFAEWRAGRHEAAIETYRTGIAASASTEYEPLLLHNLALVLTSADRPDDAVDAWERAGDAAVAAGDHVMRRLLDARLAVLDLAAGAPERAVARLAPHADDALALRGGQLLLVYSAALTAMGRTDDATAVAERAIELARTSDDLGLTGLAHIALAELRARGGDLDGAAAALTEADDIERRIGRVSERFATHRQLLGSLRRDGHVHGGRRLAAVGDLPERDLWLATFDDEAGDLGSGWSRRCSFLRTAVAGGNRRRRALALQGLAAGAADRDWRDLAAVFVGALDGEAWAPGVDALGVSRARIDAAVAELPAHRRERLLAQGRAASDAELLALGESAADRA